jgi:hypothetical protein
MTASRWERAHSGKHPPEPDRAIYLYKFVVKFTTTFGTAHIEQN